MTMTMLPSKASSGALGVPCHYVDELSARWMALPKFAANPPEATEF